MLKCSFNAALCAQVLCSHYQVTHLVNTGIAGSLSNDLDIADLVISRDAIAAALTNLKVQQFLLDHANVTSIVEKE